MYNLQTLAVVYATKEIVNPAKEAVSTTAVVNSSKVEEVKSPFGDLLVQVTKDSTVKNIAVEKPLPPPVIKKEEAVKPVVDSITAKVDKQQEKPVIKSAQKENKSDLKTANLNESKKTDSVFAVAKVEDRPLTQGINKADEMHTDTLKSEITNEIKPIVKTKEVSTQSEIITPRAAISLFATNENTESYDYIYIAEEKTGEKDTINLSIRKEKIEIKPLVINQERNKDSIKSSSKEEPKFIDIIVDTSKKASVPAIIELIKKDSIAKGVDSNAIGQQLEKIVEKEKPIEELKIEKVPEKEIIKESSKVIMVNSDCKNMATEKDFMGLRKKMVAEENDDDMVSAARKIFKTRCFTTDQVKNLCVLFLKDNGRYKFLDAAYPYVYDTDNFKQLSSLLTEEYYINRFRAMIKN
ncbi:MAG: DUF4476 domain-containing protein [Sphingobacteriales bacterium]|nr:DUF4476 domain-containing protein [Sphingobacteriales bacterium]